MKNNEMKPITMSNETESTLVDTPQTPQILPPNHRRGAFSHASDFSLSNWIAQFIFLVLPSIAILPLFWLAIFNQEETHSTISQRAFLAMAIFAVFLLGYSIWQIVKKKGTHQALWIAVSVLYLAWISLTTWFIADVFSMTSNDPWLMISALAILPVFYSMVHIIKWLTPKDTDTTLGRSSIILVLVPLVWYLMVHMVLNILHGSLAVIALILTIVATYFFIFLLLRILYLIGTRLPRVWKVAKLVLLFVMPVLCFMVTQIGSTFSFFWDYTSPMYYLLIVINGVLLLVPEPSKKGHRLLLFFGRSCLYLVVTYFFLVIAPFYSFSLIGLLFSGIGLLVLTPLFLWAFQTRLLFRSAKSLLQEFGGLKTISTGVLGSLLVPALLMGSFVLERSNFQKAFTHWNNLGKQSENIQINSKMLAKTIHFASADQNLHLPSSGVFTGGYYNEPSNRTPPPFITSLHNKVVGVENFGIPLENMGKSLSNMQNLFVNQEVEAHDVEEASYYPMDFYDNAPMNEYDILIPDEWEEGPMDSPDYASIEITKVKVDTQKEQDYYRSFVHLTLENKTEEDMMEYRTEIELPEGVFVSDYYLDVLGKRKYGLLSETTSANWIYNTVTSRFLDPGILNYTEIGLSLKVFPFSKREIRYTGIEFLHKEPVTLLLDGEVVELAQEAPHLKKAVRGEDVIFISETLKNSLPTVVREPYYIFAVDCSYESDVERLVTWVEDFIIREEIPLHQASISGINYNRQTWALEDNWKEPLLAFPRVGGFGYGLMAEELFQEIDQNQYYPVLIVAEDTYGRGFMPDNSLSLSQSTPEVGGYYTIYKDRMVFRDFSTFVTTPLSVLPPPREVKKLVLEDKSYTVLGDTGVEIVYEYTSGKTVSAHNENKWINALNFKGDEHRISMLSDSEESFEGMLQVIKKSFRSEIMSPYTSFIVLELKEQEDAMFRRQEMLLESKSWEDFYEKTSSTNFMEDDSMEDDEPGLMSEPSIFVSLALLLPLLLLYNKRKKRAH